MRLVSTVLAALALLVFPAAGQVILQSGSLGYSGSSGTDNVVLDGNGILWALSIGDGGTTRPLLLQYSTDGGTTWSNDPFVFNDASSGLSGSILVSQCSLAIDDTGTLHALWGVYSYPSYYREYYRQYNPLTTTPSAIVDLTAYFGSTQTTRTGASAITVDGNNTVWLTCQGSSSWVEGLAYSNLQYASDLTFTRISNISTSYSSQVTKLAVDINGIIHCTYYRNIGNGEYHHRSYDPATSTWSSETRLGNTPATNDEYGDVCADALGNVHCVYVVDSGGGGAASGVKLRYNKWDMTNGWGTEVVLSDIPQSNFNGVANSRIVSIACDEATGTVRVVFRDLANGGALEMVEMPLGTGAFAPVTTLAPASTAQHVYYTPTMRGTLYPAFNQCAGNWDVTWQYRATQGTPPYDLYFQRVSSAPPPPSLSLSAPAAINTTFSVDLLSQADAGGSYVCGFALGNTPGIVLPDTRVIPLNNDFLLAFSLAPGTGVFFNTTGTLDGSGQASVVVVLPNLPPLISTTVFSAFIVADPTNPTGIGTISPSLPITIQ